MRVLLIEDDRDLCALIKGYLEDEGYAVTTAPDGAEGLRLQRESPCAVVITDLFMPGKEGIETIYDLRREFPLTRVIGISGTVGWPDADYLAIAQTVGAARTLRKPFALAELAAAVRELGETER